MPVIVTSAGSPRSRGTLAAALAAACAAAAAWLSSGSIAWRAAGGARIGVLPIDALLIVPGVAAVVFAVTLRQGRGAAASIAPLAFVFLPWLPATVPPAFLIWTGPLVEPLWIAVAIGLAAACCASSRGRRTAEGAAGATDAAGPAGADRAEGDRPAERPQWSGGQPVARRDPVWAGLLGCVVFGVAAWYAAPSLPGGDEPHYLVITQSLLNDHDLNVENNYARGDYRAYYGGPLSPDLSARGRHGEMYSIHAPGLPALVLPAFAIAGYRGVVAFLIVVAAAGCALAWWLAWKETGSLTAAWFGWATVALSAPFVLESFTVYPDGPGAVLVVTGFWALRRIDRTEESPSRPMTWLLHGAALAALPWLHTRFALLAAVLGALVIVRLARAGGGAAAIAPFLTVPLISGAAWLASFYVLYGTPNPSAPYGGQTSSAFAFLPNGLGGLLFDQGFGLLATAPVLLVAFWGLLRTRRFALEWGATAVVYASAVGSYAMWWAGSSGPARFMVAVLLPLTVPAACAWSSASRGARAVMVTALVVSVWLSAALVAGSGGRLGYHSRNVFGLTAAPWLEWGSPLVDLSQALPAFVPLPEGTAAGARVAAASAGFAATVPWAVCFVAAALAVISMGRSRRAGWPALIAASAVAFGTATMAATSIVWWMHGVRPQTPAPAQLIALRRLAGGRVVTLDVTNRRWLRDASQLHMRIELHPPYGDGSAPVSIPLLPAGSFEIATRDTPDGEVSLFAGSDDEPFPLIAGGAAAFSRGVTLDLPVPVRALTIRRGGGRRIDAGELRLMTLSPPLDQMPDAVAGHAAAYGGTAVFFLDGRTAPEAEGFWTWGGREAAVVFESSPTGGGPAGPDGQATAEVPVVLRNGAVENEVTIRAGGVQHRLTMRPGEERRVAMPASAPGSTRVVFIRTSAGFRPSDVNARSRDDRFLGVFVLMPEHAVR